MAEQLKDVIILLDHDMSREDIKSSYDIVKKYGIRFKDIQIKDRRKLVKVVLESKLKEMKKIKTIIKTEKKRKREDEEDDKKEMAKVKEIGKKIKKVFKKKAKEKGILGKIIEEIQDLDMTTVKYYILKIEFYGRDPAKKFPITPFNRKKVIEILKSIVKDKFETELGGFSDGLIGMIPGKQIKSFSITANKPEWSENVFKKRREGGFCQPPT